MIPEQETQKQVCVQPAYLGRFQCDGNACGSACCCRGWHVQIGDGEYEKYASIRPAEERDEVCALIRRNEESGMYEFLHGEDEACRFLREDQLCSLQRKYGEGILPDVCAEYPRKSYRFPVGMQRALCMTCPLAEELALLGSNPMEFEQIELVPNRPDYLVPADDAERIQEICFFDLQETGIAILQDRERPLRERLVLLGFFLDRADELAEQGEGQEIAGLGELYRSAELSKYAPALLRSVPSSADRGYSFYARMLRHLAQATEDDTEETEEYLDLVGKAMDSLPYERLEEIYEKTISNYGHIWENYLVNEYFIELYPCMIPGSFVLNYRMFVSLFKLMELILFSMELRRPVMQKDILRLIQWISIRTNHYVGYMQAMRECLEQEDMELLEFMGLVQA